MRNIFFLVVFLLGLGNTYAQEMGPVKKKNTTWTRFKTDAHYMGDGFLHVLKSPARWKGKDWAIFGSVIGGVALVSLADEPIADWARGSYNPERNENLERFADLTGKPGPTVIAFSAIYGLGVAIDKQWMRDSGIRIFGALASTTLLQTISKTVAGRARPSSGYDNYTFEPFNDKPAFHSFPSGHTMASITITSVLAEQVKSIPLKIVFYSIGAGTAFARIYNGAHWTSDVVLSTVVSYAAVRTVTKRYNEKRAATDVPASISSKNARRSSLQVTPTVGGLHLVYKF